MVAPHARLENPVSTRPLPVALRVEPQAIPAIRSAFDDALADLSEQLRRVRNEGYLGEPWLGDENRHVMDSTDGPYAALVAYEAELLRVRDTLQQMEDEYRRTEGDNAELWGRV